MRTSDFAQVPRLVRVHATSHGQTGGHHVETLDRQDRIEGWVLGAGQGQVALEHVIRGGQQDTGAALAHVGGQAQQAGLLGARVLLAAPDDVLERDLTLTCAEHPALDPILAIQSFYVMAAGLAVARGMDPDQPRHLSKVTRTH